MRNTLGARTRTSTPTRSSTQVVVPSVKCLSLGCGIAPPSASLPGPLADTTRGTFHRFVREHTTADATVYTDKHASYAGLPNHEAVKHRRGEYVRGEVHTNGIESAWAILARMAMGTYHQISPKHLHSYVDELAGLNNQRSLPSLERMATMVRGLVGQRLQYRDLITGPPAYP